MEGQGLVSKKGTRKIEYNGNDFYWFVRRNQFGALKIHILSGDKKIRLEYPPIDTEVSTTPKDIRRFLDDYFKSNGI